MSSSNPVTRYRVEICIVLIMNVLLFGAVFVTALWERQAIAAANAFAFLALDAVVLSAIIRSRP